MAAHRTLAGAELRLVRETAVRSLLPGHPPHRLEASGVLAVDGRYHVIFDNLRAVAVIDQDLDRVAGNRLVPTGTGPDQAYEDIAVDPATGHVYLLIEALERGGRYLARVEEYDPRLRYLSAGWLDHPLPTRNKGMEGLACVRRDGETYLLGLCEGNRNEAGADGRRPGGGRVVVFRRRHGDWTHRATVKLPDTLAFEDYSSMSVDGDRIAVASQQSSALWLGRLDPRRWAVADAGRTYLFPRAADGGVVYGTVEGICWLPAGRFVAVSDRAKRDAGDHATVAEGQFLHIFALPDDGERG